ncbi:MAG TPA: cytochrome c maturation protein CcmE [Candidatus Limnocylindria bacterium]|nr:cytochrome c maturation protein CcmE [Candidatus Limnocylindria bacterium]
MTQAAPLPPPARRRAWGPWLAVAVIGAILAWLLFSGLSSALVYYLTPTELAVRGEAAVGSPVRLGGLVLPGSVSGAATDLTFVLTDGETEITVHSTVAPTSSFREGAGAVVEGTLRPDGVFEADEVLVRHDENYVAPSDYPQP